MATANNFEERSAKAGEGESHVLCERDGVYYIDTAENPEPTKPTQSPTA